MARFANEPKAFSSFPLNTLSQRVDGRHGVHPSQLTFAPYVNHRGYISGLFQRAEIHHAQTRIFIIHVEYGRAARAAKMFFTIANLKGS